MMRPTSFPFFLQCRVRVWPCTSLEARVLRNPMDWSVRSFPAFPSSSNTSSCMSSLGPVPSSASGMRNSFQSGLRLLLMVSLVLTATQVPPGAACLESTTYGSDLEKRSRSLSPLPDSPSTRLALAIILCAAKFRFKSLRMLSLRMARFQGHGPVQS